MKDSLFSKWKIGSSFFSKSSNQAEFYIKIGIILIKNRPNSLGKLRQQNLYKKEKWNSRAGSKQPAASNAGSQQAAYKKANSLLLTAHSRHPAGRKPPSVRKRSVHRADCPLLAGLHLRGIKGYYDCKE